MAPEQFVVALKRMARQSAADTVAYIADPAGWHWRTFRVPLAFRQCCAASGCSLVFDRRWPRRVQDLMNRSPK
jgi:hypothetical protein